MARAEGFTLAHDAKWAVTAAPLNVTRRREEIREPKVADAGEKGYKPTPLSTLLSCQYQLTTAQRRLKRIL
jgi:hypothetical protein